MQYIILGASAYMHLVLLALLIMGSEFQKWIFLGQYLLLFISMFITTTIVWVNLELPKPEPTMASIDEGVPIASCPVV
jgi:hypothetical protein